MVDAPFSESLDAFERLASSYQDRLYRLALRLLGEPGRAEDVVSEALIDAWRCQVHLLEEGAVSCWLYRAVLAGCSALAHLPPRQGLCQLLREEFELSFQQIAAVLVTTPAEVHDHLAATVAVA
ncbi:RNA polymerase sigma factor [Kutzneria viridogrisea]|uniref:RNA polymerase sigma-70 region 2 domain-containing protein n=2 Tax=Kutzneria TaxID=43356 RepID=W5WIQ1_9PSEU|nr:sigma factor [Kutzneria albida]AHH98049.1 hypothetical protein KALB_4687 [Kutzneria albida DSM 43870]MBA8924292.1 RNA polymerase sigma-70 factor (ECF subfamily) [Kutzneria viridogrisea]